VDEAYVLGERTRHGTMVKDTDPPEWPRFEPEIIPPARTRRESEWRQRVWRQGVAAEAGETRRIYVGRLGPLGIALLILILSIVGLVVLFTAVGAVLLWLPIIAILVAAGAVYRLLHR
jgi:hypothetical protein